MQYDDDKQGQADSIIDDLVIGFDGSERVRGVHLERMDTSYYWLGITLEDGTTIHVDIFKPKNKKTKINARYRERAP